PAAGSCEGGWAASGTRAVGVRTAGSDVVTRSVCDRLTHPPIAIMPASAIMVAGPRTLRACVRVISHLPKRIQQQAYQSAPRALTRFPPSFPVQTSLRLGRLARKRR